MAKYLFNNGYKIIFIKEGKFDLKQFTISPLQVGLFAGAIIFLTSSFFFMFSDQFVKWAGSHEIERHRKNNKVLVKNIEDNHKRIGNLLDELNELKKQDDVLRRLVKLPPIHDDIRKMGFGGTHNKTESEDVNYLLPEDHMDVEKMIDDINYINRLINLERLSYNEITKNVESNKDKILSYPAIHPVKSGDKDLSSNYGYRRDPFSKKYKFHDGHDYSARIGTAVYSTANGRVRKSKYWGSFGNYIEIDHGNGYITAYGHLSNRSVKVGDKVNRGQKIGEVGNTGRSTAPHLHYEVQYKNKAVDPSPFYFDIPVN